MANLAFGQRFNWTVADATTIAASGDNTIIAAPGAGLRLVIKSLTVQNESSTATTVLVQWGSAVKERRLLNQYGVLAILHEAGSEWALPVNTALIVNLSGANSHGYSVTYAVEAA
jgi:hypothetical protein